jgi:acylphosphatase
VVRYWVLISGQVQGVAFRAATLRPEGLGAFVIK